MRSASLKRPHTSTICEVKLDGFYGPLDLLLYLIKRDEIDIYDIPIAHITHQYLEYVRMIELLDLEGAGEFGVMAATLMKIKSEMLLPSRSSAIEEDGDPRADLARRLFEYQQYRELSSVLAQREADHSRVFYRAATRRGNSEDNRLEESSLGDLLTAFTDVLEAMPEAAARQVTSAGPSVEERMEYVISMMADKKRISFSKLVHGLPRTMLVVTFVALLELVRNHQVRARQRRAFGDIWLYGADS